MKNLISKNKATFTKILSATILSATLLMSTINADTGSSIKDIDTSSDYARASIMKLANNNIITGDEKGNFNPLNTVTRAEMIKMIVKALNIDTSDLPEIPTFSDVPKDHWAYEYVEAAVRENIIKGIAPGIFGINNQCTREEMAAMFVRSMGLMEDDMAGQQLYLYFNSLTDSGNISPWAKEYVEFALSTDLMQGMDGNAFGAKEPAERQQVAVVTDRFITNTEDINEFAKTFKGEMPYPELYNAMLENSRQYRGNMELNVEMSLWDTNEAENRFTFIDKMTGLMDINADTGLMNFDATYDVSMIGSDDTSLLQEQYRVIKLDDTFYVKYSYTDTWEMITQQELEELGDTSFTTTDTTSDLLKYYRYATITKEENVDFKGMSTTKYTFTLDKKAMESLTAALINEEMLDASLYQMNFSASTAEVYLNAQKQLISEIDTYIGSLWDAESETEMSFDILLDMYFYNIGQAVNIQSPIEE